jgi:hypothetical protein
MTIIYILLIIYGTIGIGSVTGLAFIIVLKARSFEKNLLENLEEIDYLTKNHLENIIESHKRFNDGMYKINQKLFNLNLNIDDFKEKSISITEEKLIKKYPENRFEFDELEPFIEKILNENDETIRKDD